jgi:hypothetical protein
VDAGLVDVAIMEDAEEAVVLATAVVVVAVAAVVVAVVVAVAAVVVAVAAEAAKTATWLRARFAASQAMKPGSVGTATPKTKKKRRKKREPMQCPMAWTQTGLAAPAPPTTSPVSSTSSP